MHRFFLAGRDLVRWDLEVLQAKGPSPLRLTVRHAQGSIVEYFRDTQTALQREQELEQLLIAARGSASSTPATVGWEASTR
jgi:hypothetical protein